MTDLRVGLTLTADGKALVGEVRVAQKALDELRKSTEESGGAARQATAGTNQYRVTLGQIRPDMVKVGQAATGAAKSIDNLGRQSADAAGDANHFRSVLARIRPDMARNITAIDRKRRALKSLNSAMTRARNGADRFGRSMRRAGQAGSRLRREFVGLKAAVGGLAFGALIRQSTQTALAYERIDLALAAATGSMEAGRSEMAFVRGESERLGLALQPVSLQYSRIAAAAIGTNLEGQATRDIFLGVAEAAGALSLSAAQTDGLFNAVEQTMSRGVVSAEEVRRQMGNALPGAFNIAAEAMGVTTDEFNKMLARGEVLSEEFLPRFAQALRDRFGAAAVEAADGATSSFNRFQNALDEAQLEFANSGFLDSVTGSLNEIRDILADNNIKANLRDLGAGLGNAFKYLVENADTLITLLTLAAGAKAALAIAGPALPPPARIPVAAGGGLAAEITRRGLLGGERSEQLLRERSNEENRRLGRPLTFAPDSEGRLHPILPEAGPGSLRHLFRRAYTEPAEILNAPPLQLIPEHIRAFRALYPTPAQLTPGEQFAQRFAALPPPPAPAPAPARTFTAESDLAEQLRPLIERERGLLPDLERAEIQLREWGQNIKSAIEEAGGDWSQYSERVNSVISSELSALYEEDAERQRRAAEEASEARIRAAAQAAEAERESYLESLRASDQFVDGVRLGFEQMRDSAETYSESIADVFQNSVTNMERAIANFVTSGKLSFADFARSVANDLLAIGIRQGITQPLFNSFFGAGGGAPAGVGPQGGILADAGRNPGFFSSIGNSFRNFFSAGSNHAGGFAGEARIRREVPALAFAGARRYHRGGIAGGLAYDEVPAILRRGEEVLRRDDPRHALNSNAPLRVEIVNRGQPAAVESAQVRNDGQREQVLSIVLRDIDDNGPLAQRLGTLFGERGDY